MTACGGGTSSRYRSVGRVLTARTLGLALALGLAARAERSINPPAVEFPPKTAWLNAEGLSLRRMIGRKAVLLAFLNPTSINSVRVLPALKAWFERYALSQLMVIAVLTPDVDFHRDPVWNKAMLRHYGIEYPAVLDSDRRIWRSYDAEGWPALFLVDHRGRVVFDQLGEGGYAEIEREIRDVLANVVGPETLPPAVNHPESRRRDCGRATREISLGARRNPRPPLSLDKDLSLRPTVMTTARDGETATRGNWDMEPDALRLAESNRDQGSFLRVVYIAAQALALLTPPAAGTGARVFVKQDNLWLHAGNAGKSVRFDREGRSYVPVDAARLYDVLRDASSQPHELYLIPDRKGVAVYGLSFSDSCSITALP